MLPADGTNPFPGNKYSPGKELGSMNKKQVI